MKHKCIIFSCSFCARPVSEIKFLISGPDVYICESCVALSVRILKEKGIEIEEVYKEEYGYFEEEDESKTTDRITEGT